MRLLRDVGGEVTLTQELAGAPTVSATRDSDGSAVTIGSVSGASPDWTATIAPAQVPEVDLVNIEWVQAGATYRTQVEIVGGFICSEADIDAALDASHTFTPAQIRAARDWAEDILERACHVAFRPRYCREKLDGSGNGSIFLSNPRPIAALTASVDGTSVTVGDIDIDPDGLFNSDTDWARGRRNVSVTYVHGYEAPPEPIRSACVRLARYHLLEDPSNMIERATSYTTEEATFTLVTPGIRGAETPIPEVNAVIDQYRYVLSVA